MMRSKIYRAFCSIDRNLTKLATYVLICLTIIVVAVTFAQVVFRYLFHEPLVWAEEVARLSYIWITFLGVPLLIRENELLNVDFLRRKFSKEAKKKLDLFAKLAIIPLLLVFIANSYAIIKITVSQVSPALGISYAWVYLIVPISGLLGLFFVLNTIIYSGKH